MASLKLVALSLSFLFGLTSCNTPVENKPITEQTTVTETEETENTDETLETTETESVNEEVLQEETKPEETVPVNPQPEEETRRPKEPTETSSLVGENDRKSWWFKRGNNHIPPEAQQDININQYDAHYLGDTSEKVIYLTFDEGYENGYTEKILDILKEKDVKAAFFVTKPYIESEPELVKRMVNEGHIVGNHSVTHPDLTTLSAEQIAYEINDCAAYFKEVTGTDMPTYFRPPQGVYSVRTLAETQKNGYKTIFWSYAYKDWDVNDQPGKQGAYDMMKNNYHNGAIVLLHAVSQSNTEALPDIIDMLRNEGYRFAPLSEL